MPAKRLVQYRRPDGSLTTDKSAAIRVSPAEVAAAVAGSLVPESYYQGSAKHESGYAINEVDTEPSGFKSYGIWQISEEEAASRGGLGEWWTLEAAARVFVPLAESRTQTILGWFNSTITTAPPDLWAWLAFGHNRGMGGPSTTKGLYAVVKRHGLDGWDDYKRNNPGDAINRYGDDCLPGFSASRTLDAIVDAVTGAGSDDDDDSGAGGGLLGGIAIALLIGGAAWYARRRWLS